MIEAQDLNAVANLEEAAAKKTNSNTIAYVAGGAMLAIGAGLGFLFGAKKGRLKGEESMKTQMSAEMQGLRDMVANVSKAAEEAKTS